MTEEEEEKPFYCPFCAEGDVDVQGKAEDGSWVVSCEDCEKDYLVRDVTGKVTVKFQVEKSPGA